jgi:hypothetical protein
MRCRGEGFVERDLHAGDLAAVEPAKGNRIAGRIGDAQHFRHAELFLGLGRVEREPGLGEREGSKTASRWSGCSRAALRPGD